MPSSSRRRRAVVLFVLLAAAVGGTASLAPSLLREPAVERGRKADPVALAAPAPGGKAPAATDRANAGRRSEPTKTSPPSDRAASVGASRSQPAKAPPEAPEEATAPVELTADEIRAGLARGEPGFEILASRLEVQKQKLEPRWQERDEWIVETWYRQMQASDDEIWSGPAKWRFKVDAETSYSDRKCHRIVVTRDDEPSFPETILYVTVDSHRLAALETTLTQQGKSRKITWVPGEGDDLSTPSAMKAQLSIAPCDLPPLGAEATVTPAGFAWPRLGLSRATLADLPRDEELVGAGGEALDVEYRSPTDGTNVYQRWSRNDSRWPVVSRTETTLSFRRSR